MAQGGNTGCSTLHLDDNQCMCAPLLPVALRLLDVPWLDVCSVLTFLLTGPHVDSQQACTKRTCDREQQHGPLLSQACVRKIVSSSS